MEVPDPERPGAEYEIQKHQIQKAMNQNPLAGIYNNDVSNNKQWPVFISDGSVYASYTAKKVTPFQYRKQDRYSSITVSDQRC